MAERAAAFVSAPSVHDRTASGALLRLRARLYCAAQAPAEVARERARVEAALKNLASGEGTR